MSFVSNLWMQTVRVLWALVFFVLITPVFGVVWGAVAIILAIVDVIGELFGMSVVEKGDLLMQAYEWFTYNVEVIVAGGEPKYLPYT
jgi:hypothetical protein